MGATRSGGSRQSHGIGRRTVLRGAGLLGLSAAMGAGIGPLPARADQPRKGGHLILGLTGGSTTDSLDPALIASQVPLHVCFQFGNCLVAMTPETRPEGEIAESWSSEDGAKRWIFKLKKGITFTNGKTVTSADVVYSLNRHRGPNSKSGAAGQMANIADIKAGDPNEVTLLLKSANVDIPYLMSDYHLIIQPEGEKPDSGIGTGPYIIEQAEPGARYHARRNPSYFKTDRAWVNSVETLVINDGTARIAALRSGRIHLMNGVDPKTVAALKEGSNIDVVSTTGRQFYYFPMMCDRPPFNNADLRLALKYAIDRDLMLKRVLMGFGSIGNDHPINPAYPLFSNDIPAHTYDPDKAKYHFGKSGFSGAILLETADAAFPGAVEACALFQQSAQAAGINLQIRRDPNDGYWDNVWLKVPFCASYWGGRPTQDQMLSIAFRSDAPWNDSRWLNPAFDKLLDAARSESDEAKRKQLYRAAVLLVHDEAGHVTPMFADFIAAMSDKLGGYISDPTLELSGARATERCWLRS